MWFAQDFVLTIRAEKKFQLPNVKMFGLKKIHRGKIYGLWVRKESSKVQYFFFILSSPKFF